ncbi:FkbM family methyltransferase [Dolichospermum flos-aquae]|uniref:FkbM family methyltransferase n=1 Tax=Dolichospermum flos-aquae LEGE 04289 TaxID=1828708 RepID=A0ACC5Q4Z5_DOLFA|nr:FkbM family methyltransferase [Dolichospermum flos-aquae]MBE9219658.1 FkbM family methyltransferase [Dolichospermum flos-aquae LEGE 04289]
MNLYKQFLKLPNFKGKASLQHCIREIFLAPKKTLVEPGFWMELDPYDWLQSEMLLKGSTEPLTTAFYQKVLKPGDTYVDVGTHVGYHTLIARQLIGDQGLVVAVEPQPYNCHKILRNWIANKYENLQLRVAAAGNQDQYISLYAQSASDSARLSVKPNNINDLSQVFYVPMITLETLFKELKLTRVKLLKIDVEGFELEVIHGILNKLDIVENILIEILTPFDKFSSREKEIFSLLKSHSFELRTILNTSLEDVQNLPEYNLLATRNK